MLNKVARGLAVAGAMVPVVVRDMVGLAGVGLIAYGAWLIMPAAGFIVGGALLLAGTILISAKSN